MRPDAGDADDVRTTAKRAGYLSPKIVTMIVFVIITVCILSGVVVSILAIWDYAERDVLYRTLATLAVVALGSLLFGMLNDRFGR